MELVRAITIPADQNKPLVHRRIKQSDLETYRYWTGGEAIKAVLLVRPAGVLYVPVTSTAFNSRATSLVRKHRDTPANEIFGDALLLGYIDSSGQDLDVTEDYVSELVPQNERYRVEILFPDAPTWANNAMVYDDYEEALRLSSYMVNQYDRWRIVPADRPFMEQYTPGAEDGTGPHEKGVWENGIDVIALPADISKRPRFRTIHRGKLDDYQGLVHGNIEKVDIYNPDATVFINEDGDFLGLEINPRAEELVNRHRPGFIGYNRIRGDVIVLGQPDENGDSQSVPRQYLVELGLIRE